MILVSACLIGKNCKYNGGNNKNETVIKFLQGKEYIAICPESAGGLPIPRMPAEISGDRVIQKNGNDVTEEFISGAEKIARAAKESSATLAILKESSPSCGVNLVYDGSFSGKKIPGQGITCKMLEEMGIEVKSEVDLEKEI